MLVLILMENEWTAEMKTKWMISGLDKQNLSAKNCEFFSYPSILTYIFGAQKNRLIETVLLSTHNICFG